jgi:hypothetical protein
MICAIDDSGDLLRVVDAAETLRMLQALKAPKVSHDARRVPNLSLALNACRNSLKEMLDVKTEGQTLSLTMMGALALF